MRVRSRRWSKCIIFVAIKTVVCKYGTSAVPLLSKLGLYSSWMEPQDNAMDSCTHDDRLARKCALSLGIAW